MSLSNFIKNILNIQDNNISFPEEDYCQIVKNGDRKCNIKFIPFQSYNIELNLSIQRYICRDCKKAFSPSTNIVDG